MAGLVVVVNGESRPVDVGATVADLVAVVSPTPKGIAVAVDSVLVPRSQWAATTLVGGEHIEVLTAAQGG